MLLIMSCSGNKREGDMAACRKYAGRQHDVALDYAWNHGLEVAYLSAEHGLIALGAEVADYDRLLDTDRARLLAADPIQRQRAIEMSEGHDEVAVYGGKLYRETIKALFPDKEVIEVIGEGRGCGDHFAALASLVADEDD